MSTLSYAFAKVTTGFRLADIALKGIEMCFHRISRILLTRPSAFIIPTVKQQIALTLSKATVGSLTIIENGESMVFGNPDDGGPHICLTVLSEQFWVRLMLVQDLGFAEAYMAGEIAVDNLVNFIRFYIYNRAALDTASSSPLVSSLMYLASTRFGNSVLNTASNISAHYDLGNEMFEMFLDSSMTYSCAIWDGPGDTLEAAQLRKLDMLIDKAHLRPTDYVLDLGCGWGSLSMRAVQRTGCRVLGITLSTEQKEVAEQRIAKAGMSDRIKIMLIDYRNLNPAEHCFDRIISLEMVEHVGYEYLPVYFEQCHKLLHPQHGVMVLQASTMNEERYSEYRHTVDFINKHIFPGGHCPSVSALVAGATKGSNGMLMLESAANFPDHYARTLRVWRERFLSGYDKVLAMVAPKNPQLILQERELVCSADNSANNCDTDRPRISSDSSATKCGSDTADSITDTLDKTGSVGTRVTSYNDVFRRKWEYYFAYCEGAFATRTLGCTQLVFSRTYNECLSDASILV
ncbi:Mycolic acid cyclopropane synthetase-domain-containing protein [Kickxella alabastrina]|uniref:Mycolic acid cyclopropane synthetase-domain-containing protein n=1 Tax=Kickxella alabastrina TaxID=61397 RepID=UPI002220860D|nr:Mycolic acid cyclopropane synthetase-domain-containing protein [Kickxella alabastrina]KAI7835114.1 Mycolic acid cyclopropane synthetase-domain-containing protein [Kickxella alabastrina]